MIVELRSAFDEIIRTENDWMDEGYLYIFQSISITFYERIVHMKVLAAAFLQLRFGFGESTKALSYEKCVWNVDEIDS